jgi:hypothetical protein
VLLYGWVTQEHAFLPVTLNIYLTVDKHDVQKNTISYVCRVLTYTSVPKANLKPAFDLRASLAFALQCYEI